MKITAHSIVKNEQNWVWYSIMSVLDQVDEVMVWDTGSTDSTVDIIKSIPSPKVKLRQIDPVSAQSHTQTRQAMLEATSTDWILILDGDEIWWWDSLRCTITQLDSSPQIDAVISPVLNVVGDVFHLQLAADSNYRIHEFHGAYNIRFIRTGIPGLHVANPHGRQEYRNQSELALQYFPRERLLYRDQPYLHTSHLIRSASRDLDKQTLKRSFKYRYQTGSRFPSDFTFPEPFYLPRPQIVPSPWSKRGVGYLFTAHLASPLRTLKRAVISQTPDGY